MKTRHCVLTALIALGLSMAFGVAEASAQQVRTVQDDDWCDESWGDREHERYCEVREVTLGSRDRLTVDGRTNGGIRVEGWDRDEILIRARVHAQAESEEAAREIVGDIRLDTGGTIEADGPRTGRHEWWSVSYRIFVPRNSDLDLTTLNGGIRITDVSGDISFRATNGGVSLDGLSGDVSGSTTNGGLNVELTGEEWEGAGMDVRTTNGGVKINVPDGYSAHIESGTVNGAVRIDFPITVQGRIDRRISADLGRGGKTIRAVTTNGGVVIRRT